MYPEQQQQPDATILMDGISLISFDDQQHCQVGMLDDAAGDHHFKLVIRRTQRGSTIKLDHCLDLKKNICVDAINSSINGVVRYIPYSPGGGFSEFDRAKDIGDPHDFRWILDLEGPEFHGHRMTSTGKPFKSNIFISSGIMYTAEKTEERFGRITLCPPGNPDPRFLGKGADVVGIDLICNVGKKSGIVLKDKCGKSVCLPKETGVHYEIRFENNCVKPLTSPSDFQLYYNAFKDSNKVVYDLVRVVISDDNDHHFDGMTEACNGALASGGGGKEDKDLLLKCLELTNLTTQKES
jgi:hypothetical protein